MKKPSLILLILLALFTISPGLKAQYSIPTATQQPAWVFPIYFEEGTGLRDTIYLGYDPSATSILGPYPGSIDTVFGEDYEVIDTSEFRAYWTSCCDGVDDTVLRVNISDSAEQMGYAIQFNKGVLPLTIKWDKSLFYSDSLPYPDQSPAPYAQGLIIVGSSMSALDADSSNCCGWNIPMLISDTTKFGGKCQDLNCCRIDSVYYTYYCTSISAPISYIGFSVVAWNGEPITNSIQVFEGGKLEIKVYPTPATTNLQIDHEVELIGIKLFDVGGQEIHVNTDLGKMHSSINVLNVPSGIYFLQIDTHSSRSFRKLIVNH